MTTERRQYEEYEPGRFRPVDTIGHDRGNGHRPDEMPDFPLTDAGNALYFCHLYGDQFRYDHARKRWLHWEGHRWEPRNDGIVMQLALESVQHRYTNAVNIDHSERNPVSKWATQSESRQRQEALIALAREYKPIDDNGKDWDTDPYLFGVKNGVIDLRTGQRRDGKPEDRITMQSPVAHDTSVEAPTWERFIDQITGGDKDLADYLQCAAGYSMTGAMTSQVWFFLYGLGTNGKTTFTMTLRRLMGDYGIRMDADDLMIKDKKTRGSSPKEGVADTRGKRFAVASEVQDGRRLDIGLLKDMTGQDSIKARRLYEHEVEFIPTHKLFMFGNHKPVIMDTTNAAWRRLKLIPFTFTVPEDQIDPELQSKLEAELPGILNWVIEGCLNWQREGLREPACVTDAVTAYRFESDILAGFIEDCCVLEPLAIVGKKELKEAYEQWCKDNGQEPITRHTFKTRLTEKGISEDRNEKTRYWKGIRLRTDDDTAGEDVPPENDKTLSGFEANMTKLDQKSKSPSRARVYDDFIENNDSFVILSGNEADNPDKTSEDRITEALLMEPSDVIQLWHDWNEPPIELAQGTKCTDLAKLLSNPDVSDDHLAAVRRWLDSVREGGCKW